MSQETVLFGIANCDTVKKARAQLQASAVAYRFHDFKKDGVPHSLLVDALAQNGWQPLLNRQGTTWRKLSEAEKAAIADEASASALMQAQPSVIKRPLIRWPGGDITVGWDAAVQAGLSVRASRPAVTGSGSG